MPRNPYPAKSRIMAALAAMFIALGLSVASASPAQAAYGGTTADNSISFYQWTGFGAQVAGDRWQTSYNNVIAQGGCLNLGGTWANGTSRNDNTASLMFRTGNTTAYAGYTVRVYNWANCNGGGYSRLLGYLGSNGYQFSMDNLNNYDYNFPSASGISMYHTATSIQIRNPLD